MTTWPKPEWKPIWLECRSCGKQWDDWQPVQVPIETWVAHCRTFRCTGCGKGIEAHTIVVRGKPLGE